MKATGKLGPRWDFLPAAYGSNLLVIALVIYIEETAQQLARLLHAEWKETLMGLTFASGLRHEVQLTKDLAIFEERGCDLVITVDLTRLAREYTEDSSKNGSMLYEATHHFYRVSNYKNRASQGLTSGKDTKLA